MDKSFDQSLKHQLHDAPADFIRFGLDDPSAVLLGAAPSALPARGREVDGCYRAESRGQELAVHIEFDRRNQSFADLATDVGEAQVRLYRRERVPVLSLVWDLYGDRHAPLLSRPFFVFGADLDGQSTRCVWRCVNLRGIGAAELLERAPPGLWPLVPLTRDGTTEQAVLKARDAISARPDLDPARRADHLAVLWFLAGAEDVPVAFLKAMFTKEQLMQSELYRSVYDEGMAEGEARGKAEGEARGRAAGEAGALREFVVRLLAVRLGSIATPLSERIRTETNIDNLRIWCDEAIRIMDADGAHRLADIILASAPPGSGSNNGAGSNGH